MATVVTPFSPQPFLRASWRADQSLNEPEFETPIFLPLRSSIVLIGESQGTPTARKGAGPVVSQTAIIGAPLATNAISLPAPSPISTLPAATACAILLPPPSSTIFRSSPCFLKMPSSLPTFTGMIASDVGDALPTIRVLSAIAGTAATPSSSATLAAIVITLIACTPRSNAEGRGRGRRRASLRQIGLGIKLRHIGLLIEQLQLDERALQRRERFIIEAAIRHEHADRQIVFARHHARREMRDAGFDLYCLRLMRAHISDGLHPASK